SLKTSIKTITYLSDTGCLEIQGASLTDDRSTESRGCGRSKIVELDFINLSPVVDELNTKLPESGLSGRESETGYY
ncbi:hypothetical protein, partial [Escherichia coli]|uniref:hypothetical protein n=1 Tax=Escherichia coli TaxID=562 RepID=UPI001BC89C55